MVDSLNLQEMIQNMIVENMERNTILIQNPKENHPKDENVSQGAQEDKDIVYVDQPFINKNIPRGIDSRNGSKQGWSPRGIQLPKINMRKYDGKDPIPWIFQLE